MNKDVTSVLDNQLSVLDIQLPNVVRFMCSYRVYPTCSTNWSWRWRPNNIISTLLSNDI